MTALPAALPTATRTAVTDARGGGFPAAADPITAAETGRWRTDEQPTAARPEPAASDRQE